MTKILFDMATLGTPFMILSSGRYYSGVIYDASDGCSIYWLGGNQPPIFNHKEFIDNYKMELKIQAISKVKRIKNYEEKLLQ